MMLAMLGGQIVVGVVNELVDAENDRLTKSSKPIPAGEASQRGAMTLGVAGLVLMIVAGVSLGDRIVPDSRWRVREPGSLTVSGSSAAGSRGSRICSRCRFCRYGLLSRSTGSSQRCCCSFRSEGWRFSACR